MDSELQNLLRKFVSGDNSATKLLMHRLIQSDKWDLIGYVLESVRQAPMEFAVDTRMSSDEFNRLKHIDPDPWMRTYFNRPDQFVRLGLTRKVSAFSQAVELLRKGVYDELDILDPYMYSYEDDDAAELGRIYLWNIATPFFLDPDVKRDPPKDLSIHQWEKWVHTPIIGNNF